jgi:hypothetical protein
VNNCCFEADLDIEPLFHVVSVRKARKPHRCCECKCEIKPGDKYERATGKWDGRIDTFKTCIPCQRIRDDLCCSFEYGGLRDVVWEYLKFDYVTGECQEEDDE